MTEEAQVEIIETGPVVETPSPVSTEGMAADLSAELAAEDAAKAEAEAAKAEKPKPKESSKSIDEALEKALAKAQGKEEEAKPETEDKTDKAKVRGTDGKFVSPEKAADKAGEAEAATRLQSEGKQINAPARLLPSERDVWVNTPRAVQGAFERIEREIEEVSEKSREAMEFREGLRQYDDMAKSANTTVKDALDRYVAMDKKIAANFGEGVADIARSFGKNPVQAVAEFMRAAGVAPQQLGAYLQGNPAQPAAAQAQPKVDPVAARALQEVAQLKQMLQQQQVQQEEAAKISELERLIDSAKADMPRFDELQSHIAKYLQSGMIDNSLSPDVRLREAYHAVDRIYPALRDQSEAAADPDIDSKVTTLPRKKQISGSPTASNIRTMPKGPAPSIDEALEAALRRASKR